MSKTAKATHKVIIRFTEEEYAQIKDRIRKTRLSKQAYFRKLIRGEPIREHPDDTFFSFYSSLRKIVVNLNQIVMKAMFQKLPEYKTLYVVADVFNTHCTNILNMMIFGKIQ